MENINFYNFTPLIPIKIQLLDGIHLVKRPSVVVTSKEHYGAIIVGKSLRQLGYFDEYPRVFHLDNEGIHIDLLPKINNWNLVKSAHPLQMQNAITRLNFAIRNPNYDLFSNNCEQFARYIVEGNKQSTQLQNTVALVGLAAGSVIWANSK